MHKNLLILTLGTGAFDRSNNKETYVKTQYYFEDKPFYIGNIPCETSFVAEPLINMFRPDEIVILGTVKSAWSALYSSFSGYDEIRENDENYKFLLSIRNENGVSTSCQKLEECEKQISNILNKIDITQKFPDINKTPRFTAVLTRYGINDQQLIENYSIIKSIENLMNEKYAYNVAFDITHSFRSLPIYNLVVFNYIKHITKYKINISHVYYGNLDVKNEIGKAPIVDLRDLVNVMDLTNSVSEFKNTGNIKTLGDLIQNDELRKALHEFDWATQLNSFYDIDRAVNNLFKQLLLHMDDSNKYADASKMIYNVLCDRFLMIDQYEYENALSLYEKMSDAEKQIRMAKWYQNQNRYGLAVATAYEALRSVLVEIYIKEIKHKVIDSECVKDEEYRRCATNRLGEINKLLDRMDRTIDEDVKLFFIDLEDRRQRIVDIRNRFAHNLRNKMDIENYIHEKIEIDEFINKIDELKELIATKYQDIISIYAIKSKAKKKKNKKDYKEAVIINLGNKDIIYPMKNHFLYGLDIDILSEIKKTTNNFFSDTKKITQIIMNSTEEINDVNNVRIYLMGFDDGSKNNNRDKLMKYNIFLQNMGFKDRVYLLEEQNERYNCIQLYNDLIIDIDAYNNVEQKPIYDRVVEVRVD